LIVQDGLKEVDNSIKHVHATVRFVKNGTSRLVKFKECAALEKVECKAFLRLDVCTRWNSTHDMLQAVCTYEKVFARYADEDPYYTIELLSDIKPGVPGPGVPDEQDWENARKLGEFLGHFAGITNCISTSLSVTAHTLFHDIGEINELVHEWMSSTDSVQIAMAMRMKDKYEKYWGQWHENVELEKDNQKGNSKEKEKENINLLIFFVVVLDPRFKLSQYVEVAVDEMYGAGIGQKVWAVITKCLHELFEEYRIMYSPTSESNFQSSDSTTSKQDTGDATKFKTRIAKRMRLNSGSTSYSGSRGCRIELDKCNTLGV
jgi:hypothetical protein